MARVFLVFITLVSASAAFGAEINVKTTQQLNQAVLSALPGDTITLAPGRYPTSRINIQRAGTMEQPITLRADKLGEARIESEGVVGIRLNASYWHFENLDIVGQCEPELHINCEHAFHIFGDADGVEIRSTRMVNFNAAIKANGIMGGATRVFPDDVVVTNAIIYNTSPRQTRNPVTAIDVVGGKRWVITDNFIADYGRADGIASYQGFLKGNSSSGVMARNLAICDWRHSSPGRVGLSLGGGGTTNNDLCEDQNCDVEHENGSLYGNIIANCPSEPGLYLNASENTRISGNLLFRTTGIQLHTKFASAEISGNILNSGMRDRDGSNHTATHNEVYGIHYGGFLPAVSAYVQLRLEGQDKKFPSIISPWMVDMAQNTVSRILGFIAGSPLGLGQWSMDSAVLDSVNFNVTLESPGDFAMSGLAHAETDTDFCGRSRAGDATAGPFIGSEAPCDMTERIRRVVELERQYPVP